MKPLNINIPTTVRFIRKLSRIWVLILLTLLGLLYAYFWLNSIERKDIHISLSGVHLSYSNVNVSISLNNQLNDVIGLPTGDIITVRTIGEIEDSLTINDSIFNHSDSLFNLHKTSSLYNLLPEYQKRNIKRSHNKPVAVVTVDTKEKDNVSFLKDYANRRKPLNRACPIVMNGIVIEDKGSNGFIYFDSIGCYKYISEDIYGKHKSATLKHIYDFNKKNITPNKFAISEYFVCNVFDNKRTKSYTRIRLFFSSLYNGEYSFNGDYSVIIDTRQNPILINSIYPEPDEKTFSKIVFKDKAKLKEIFQNGIIINSENLKVRDFNDKINFILASFIGVLFSILAEIGVKRFDRKSTDRT